MRTKIGMAVIGILAMVVVIGSACKKEPKKDNGNNEPPAKDKSAPPGMVLVPAGEFTMGMSADDALKECQKYYDECKRDWFTDEKPVHTVDLDAYYIDKTEVTQEEYDKCVSAGKCKANKKYDGFTGSRQPVVGVDWEDARSYCAWAGKRLPTEAEWEKAARGTDGRIYPWGNEFDGKKANFCDKNCQSDGPGKAWDDGYKYTAPVGSYPAGASPYGALDMAGNVLEWTADWYADDYYNTSPAKNPKGPDTGSLRVLRGGHWSGDPVTLRASLRNYYYPDLRYIFHYFGFRCARD